MDIGLICMFLIGFLLYRMVSFNNEISKKHEKLTKNTKVKIIDGFHKGESGIIVGYNPKRYTQAGGLFTNALYEPEHWVVELENKEKVKLSMWEMGVLGNE